MCCGLVSQRPAKLINQYCPHSLITQASTGLLFFPVATASSLRTTSMPSSITRPNTCPQGNHHRGD